MLATTVCPPHMLISLLTLLKESKILRCFMHLLKVIEQVLYILFSLWKKCDVHVVLKKCEVHLILFIYIGVFARVNVTQ